VEEGFGDWDGLGRIKRRIVMTEGAKSYELRSRKSSTLVRDTKWGFHNVKSYVMALGDGERVEDTCRKGGERLSGWEAAKAAGNGAQQRPTKRGEEERGKLVAVVVFPFSVEKLSPLHHEVFSVSSCSSMLLTFLKS
jgi:hypothetical protein